MWTLPILIVIATVALSIPIGRYMAKVMDTSFRPPTAWLRWIESRLDTGPQNWKQYAIAMMLFSTAGFVVGFAILAFQPWLPLNPDHKGMLSPRRSSTPSRRSWPTRNCSTIRAKSTCRTSASCSSSPGWITSGRFSGCPAAWP